MKSISVESALEAVDNLEDYALMAGVNPSGPVKTLFRFIAQYGELDSEKQTCEKLYMDLRDQSDKSVARIHELEAENNAMREALKDLVGSSEGVYGLHLNGDDAPWEELLEGGRYEDWLLAFAEEK